MSELTRASPCATRQRRPTKPTGGGNPVPPGISTASFSKPVHRFSGNTQVAAAVATIANTT